MDQRLPADAWVKVDIEETGTIVYRLHARQSKTITGLVLGVWLFALLVGVGHACNSGELGMTPGQHPVASASAGSSDVGVPAGCEQFCASDVPVVTKLPLLGEPPNAQPLIVAVNSVHAVVTAPPADLRVPVARPPSDVPPFLLFTRLRL
jgi:hypothetical protein